MFPSASGFPVIRWPPDGPSRGPSGSVVHTVVGLVMRMGQPFLDDLAVLRCQLFRPDPHGQLVQLSGEGERDLVVLVVHSITSINANIERLVDGDYKWSRMRDFLVCYLGNFRFMSSMAARSMEDRRMRTAACLDAHITRSVHAIEVSVVRDRISRSVS